MRGSSAPAVKCRAAPSALPLALPHRTLADAAPSKFSRRARSRAGLGYRVEVLGPAQSHIVSHGLRPQSDRLVWSGSAHGQIRLFDGGPPLPTPVSPRFCPPARSGGRGTSWDGGSARRGNGGATNGRSCGSLPRANVIGDDLAVISLYTGQTRAALQNGRRFHRIYLSDRSTRLPDLGRRLL